MIRRAIGNAGLAYALKVPEHRGKFRALRLLDSLFGPFELGVESERMRLLVFLSSSMDMSYFRRRGEGKDCSDEGELDQLTPKLIKELRQGDLFVDVGANIGYLSIMASRTVGENGLVISFEPSVREYNRLVANLALNGAANVLPVQAALGDRPGTADFDVSAHHTGLNRLSVDATRKGFRIQVQVLNGSDCLDALCAGRKVALVKIDVEGAEVQVLRGLVPFLRRHRPSKVVVEVTPRFLAAYGSSRAELYDLMAQLGFEPQVNSDEPQYDELFRLPSA